MKAWPSAGLTRLLASPLLARVWAGFVGGVRAVAGLRRVPALDHPVRILIVKLDRIGDMVLTSPLVRELRRAFPGAWITLVAAESLQPLLQACPHVSELFYLRPETVGPRAMLRRWRDNTRLAWCHLRARCFTHALLPRYGVDHYLSYHLLALAGARERIGFSVDVDPVKAAKNRGCDQCLTQVLPRVTSGHEVERLLAVLTALGHQASSSELELWLDPACRDRAAQTATRWASRTIVGVCPSSHELVRDWPFSCFLEVFTRFASTPRVQFFIFGGPELQWIDGAYDPVAFPHVENLTGRLRLDDTAALIAHCDLFLSVDTGLMHLAAAQRVPIVEISSQPRDGDPNHHHSPARFGPWGVKHRILAPGTAEFMPANKRLIELVTVDEVVAAMRELQPALA